MIQAACEDRTELTCDRCATTIVSRPQENVQRFCADLKLEGWEWIEEAPGRWRHLCAACADADGD